jgi:integrase
LTTLIYNAIFFYSIVDFTFPIFDDTKLPITGVDERRQYKNAITLMNRRLKDIGRMVGLTHPLTMHCARHSWASVAKHKRIPLSVISESMGHDSEGTTMIYLSSLDTAVIDEANKQVLKELF